MRIYVADKNTLYGDAYFWVIEAEEKDKTYKVLQAWEYTGQNKGRETSSLFLLKFYRKDDERVFLDFEPARKKAIENIKDIIERQEEELRDNKEKLEAWKT